MIDDGSGGFAASTLSPTVRRWSPDDVISDRRWSGLAQSINAPHWRRDEEGLEAGRGSSDAPQAIPVTIDRGASEAPEPAPEEAPPVLDWVEVVVKTHKGDPMPGVSYEIELSNGRLVSGRTNALGIAHIRNVEPGTAKLRLPKLEAYAWKDA